MVFNPNKCTFIRFSRNKNVFRFENVMLENGQYFNDLRITVSSDLTFNVHINNIVKKAHSRLGPMRRCLGFSLNVNVKTIVIRLN